MTVASEIITKTYMGNGLTRVWPIPFELPLDGAQYVQVYITEPDKSPALLTSGYSVNQTAMTVKYPIGGDPLAKGYKITIRRQLPYTQETDLNSQGPFDPGTIERTFDRNVMQIQQLAEAVDRAAKVPIGSTEGSDDLWNGIQAQIDTATAAAGAATQSATEAAGSAEAAAQHVTSIEHIAQEVRNAGASAVDDINASATAGVSQVQEAAETGISQISSKVEEAAASAEAAAQSAEEAARYAEQTADNVRGLEFDWDETKLGVRREGDTAFEYSDLQGPAGPSGQDGADGVGVPVGGTVGQLLTKAGEADFDAVWQTLKVLDSTVETIQDEGMLDGVFMFEHTITVYSNIIMFQFGLLGTVLLTFAFPEPLPAGTIRVLTLFITNGGVKTIAWVNGINWHGGTAPTLNSSGVDVINIAIMNGSRWYGMHVGSFPA